MPVSQTREEMHLGDIHPQIFFDSTLYGLILPMHPLQKECITEGVQKVLSENVRKILYHCVAKILRASIG